MMYYPLHLSLPQIICCQAVNTLLSSFQHPTKIKAQIRACFRGTRLYC